jgi:hypothetical protein
MNVLLLGIMGGLAGGGAPRPSGAGSTRQPEGCGSGGGEFWGGELLAGESEARSLNVLPATGRPERPPAPGSGLRSLREGPGLSLALRRKRRVLDLELPLRVGLVLFAACVCDP